MCLPNASNFIGGGAGHLGWTTAVANDIVGFFYFLK